MARMQFIVTKDSQHSWHWHLYKSSTRSAPRAIAKSAEGFSSRANALRAVADIRKTIPDLSIIEIVASDTGTGNVTTKSTTNVRNSARTAARRKPSSKRTNSSIVSTRICAVARKTTRRGCKSL
jgi:uncharacterized protein YegP (UPF0339 family)